MLSISFGNSTVERSSGLSTGSHAQVEPVKVWEGRCAALIPVGYFTRAGRLRNAASRKPAKKA